MVLPVLYGLNPTLRKTDIQNLKIYKPAQSRFDSSYHEIIIFFSIKGFLGEEGSKLKQQWQILLNLKAFQLHLKKSLYTELHIGS